MVEQHRINATMLVPLLYALLDSERAAFADMLVRYLFSMVHPPLVQRIVRSYEKWAIYSPNSMGRQKRRLFCQSVP